MPQASDVRILGILQFSSPDRVSRAVQQAIAEQPGGTDLIIREIVEKRLYYFFANTDTVQVKGTVIRKRTPSELGEAAGRSQGYSMNSTDSGDSWSGQ